jgi:hypothetical protein
MKHHMATCLVGFVQLNPIAVDDTRTTLWCTQKKKENKQVYGHVPFCTLEKQTL